MNSETQKYYAIDIAYYIIDKCDQIGNRVNNLKLQYILYLLQKNCIKETGAPLFPDDICAWHFGPCVPNVYYEFCMYAEKELHGFGQSEDLPSSITQIVDHFLESNSEKEFWSANNLCKEACMKAGAWETVYVKGTGNRGTIPLDLIKEELNYQIVPCGKEEHYECK